MLMSGDVMGLANTLIEQNIGGISMFVNADAGDVDPAPGTCDPVPNFLASNKIAQAVAQTRSSLQFVSTGLSISSASIIAPFGLTQLNMTLSRIANCTSGGELDICTICRVLDCDLNLHLDNSWVEENPRFSAVRLNVYGKNFVLATMPGEPLYELGLMVKADAAQMGFDDIFIFGYSQNHMGYFCTPAECKFRTPFPSNNIPLKNIFKKFQIFFFFFFSDLIGGYESQLTFWGIDTALEVRKNVDIVMNAIAPSPIGEKK